MWKLRVLHSRFAAGLGGNSARFAGEILARRAPAPDSGLYPEAWLVFREEEERAAEQVAGEVRLTQITLRLALQLSEYFTASVRQERTVMEVASLRQTLRTCLTALETRDRETCREVRTLMALSREEKGAEPSASAAVRERETLRERLTERLTLLERRERRTAEGTVFSKTVLVPGTGERRAEQKTEHQHGERQEFPRERTPAASSAAFLWRRAASHAPGAMTVSGRTVSLQTRRTETVLTEHKERFLELLSRMDAREQTNLWRTVEEQVLLTAERRRQWTEEYHLTAQEKLERLVRGSTLREYRSLLQVLERQVRAGSALPAEPSEKAVSARESTDEITAPARRETGVQAEAITPLVREAAPLVDWISQTLRQGRVQRKAMLAQMEAAPESAQRAFLTLARESGAFHVIKKGEQQPSGTTVPPAMEGLTLLTRESRRQELETLVRWTRARVEWEASQPPASPAKAEQKRAAPSPRRETAAAAELRQFLLRERETDRALTQVLSEIRPGEREVLYKSLRELTGGQPARERAGEIPAEGEVLRLLERTGDPVRLLEQIRTTETFRTAQTARLREQTVLERLRTFSQQREKVRERETERLVQGLDREERLVLLEHLQTIREIPQSSRQGGTEQAQPEQLLRQVLTFATNKEYNTFQQQLTQYLQRQTEPSRPVLAPVLRWAEDRRRWERLEKAAPPAETAERVLRLESREVLSRLRERQRETVVSRHTVQVRPSPAPRLPAMASVRPPAVKEPAASPVRRTAEAMAPVWRQPKQQSEPPQREPALPARRAEERQVFPETILQRENTRQETRTLRETVLRQTGEAPVLPKAPAAQAETAPLTLRQENPAAPPREPRTPGPVRSASTLLPPREGTAAVTWRRAAETGVRARPSKPSQSPASPALRFRTPPAEREAAAETPAAVQAPPHREEQIEAEPLVVRRRTEVLAEEETTRTEAIWRDIALLTRVRLEKKPVEIGRKPGPISVVASLERPLGKRTLSLLQRREEQSAPLERWGSQPPQSAPEPRRTAQPSVPARRAVPAKTAVSPAEPPELELRRDRTPETARETAQRAVEERVELAMERQAPQLRLLRRQSQEQERVLEEQRNDLSSIKKRLERQEAQVRQAVAQTRIPAAEEPAQVRRLAKAVMKELEGQLRLERQRRGLS